VLTKPNPSNNAVNIAVKTAVNTAKRKFSFIAVLLLALASSRVIPNIAVLRG
jgi:hypothetical protein